jgi:hypothetical protein
MPCRSPVRVPIHVPLASLTVIGYRRAAADDEQRRAMRDRRREARWARTRILDYRKVTTY